MIPFHLLSSDAAKLALSAISSQVTIWLAYLGYTLLDVDAYVQLPVSSRSPKCSRMAELGHGMKSIIENDCYDVLQRLKSFGSMSQVDAQQLWRISVR